MTKAGNPHRYKNLVGQRFNRLTVLELSEIQASGLVKWLCLCDCGEKAAVAAAQLRNGQTRSCGCLKRELTSARHRKHGECGSDTHVTYISARQRCRNPKNVGYKYYGGRGIEFRFDSFEEFVAEVGRKPSPEMSLERIDANGHYEKGNICWADDFTQANNRTNNRHLTYKGVTQTIGQWARQIQLAYGTLTSRLKYGWCTDCAIEIPTGSKAGSAKTGCPHK